jgi:hypothetical protein
MSLVASCLVAADGTLSAARGVNRVFREGAGIYHLVLSPGYSLHEDEYHMDATARTAARHCAITQANGAAPVGGANPATGETAITVRTYQSTDGAAADSAFSFHAQRR